MAFHVHRAERTDLLADSLGALLAAPQDDPFAGELVLVPARGVERWLSQRLSHVLGRSGAGADGVCAGVSFRSPRSLIAELTGSAGEDPWSPDALVWPLLRTIDESLGESWCGTVATHLGQDSQGEECELRRGRRYAVARRLAGLFASYAAQRPQLLIDWLAGDLSDGAGGVLDDDLHWQAQLWRALTRRIGTDPPHVRHQETLARLRLSGADLPPRLSLFGHTRMARTDLELLEALSVHHDLHLWLPHPSDNLWRSLADARGPVRRTQEPQVESGHPLLTTLGRDLRELQRALPPERHVDEDLGDVPGRPETLLGWLQADIHANAVRPGSRVRAAADRSVQVHSCHGQYRQIEVLREVLLGLLADDPTLEPRDILVMCPDIETYAPLIVAGFGLGDVAAQSHPAHRLRVRLADRSLTQTNALLGVVDQVLSLAGGRATASQVLNLAEAAPVRARFGFTDDDLEAVTAWVRESGIRWGFDAAHRAPYRLDGVVQNTWRFGLDRILAGVAMSDDAQAWVQSTLPLDDVGSNNVELAGRLSEYVARLADVIDSLTGTKPLVEWLDSLQVGVAQLACADGDDAWQTGQLQREFADILAQAGEHTGTILRLNDIRSLLGGRLAGRPTRANFRTGTLTVCTMVPMRSIPHRVVCLVGLDDDVFPRLDVVDGDDVLVRSPMSGERDIRSEDRQLLLDAVVAAQETLVITYTGADEYSGRRRPPAVPLAELLDALDQTTTSPVRAGIVVEHPLQPFDVKNVTPGALNLPTPFTFDRTALTAAKAAVGRRPPPPEFPDGPLLPPPVGDVELADLIAFFRHPVRGFFRSVDMALPRDVDGIDDAIPVELDNLQAWQAGDWMLDDLLRGRDPRWVLDAAWRRGTLPPGRLGWRQAKQIRDQAQELALAAAPYRAAEARAVDIDFDLGGGRRLTGTVAPVHGDSIVAATYSRLDGKHLLEAWIRLLALSANDPDREWTAVCIGRGSGDRPVACRVLGNPDDSRAVLADLVAIYDTGRTEPVPLPLKASYAWAEARRRGKPPDHPARNRWKSGNFPGEDADPAHTRVWGGPQAPLTRLLEPPRSGEEVMGEETRLGAYAARVWVPLLRAERRVR